MILVIGGAGYIGSHMCKLLREQNEPHVVFDNLETGHEQALNGSRLVRGDLRKADDIKHAIEANHVDTVMHFGAYIMVGESVQKPAEYYENNFVGVMNLLNAMRDTGVLRLVFSSTAAVFGEPEYVPIDEDHPKDPTSPYGDTKLAVERMLAAYDRAYGIKNVCLRYFNAAGADPDGVLGEDHDPETHLIPAILLAGMGKTPGLKIFGTDYDTPDGTCVRDYVHVMDLAQAHLLAIKHLRDGGDSRRYNLGNGQGFSVRQVIDTVERIMGKPIPQETSDRRPGDPATLVASSERIRKDWGWTPKYPELDTIVQHAWAWREAHPDGYR